MRRNCIGRLICVTQRGFLSLVPGDVKVGDPIAICQGASFPYVLRKIAKRKGNMLVGECFVPRYASRWGQRVAEDKFRLQLNRKIKIF